MRIFAPAKINLFLHVGDRRADGYHQLQSLMAFADIGDDLTIVPDTDLSLAVAGPFSQALQGDENNIVLKAARALARHASRAGARMTLEKNLPVASGIGGGSTDAAAALRGLCQLWDITLAETDLQTLALSLGADVPVCLNAVPCWAEGIGERLTPIPAFPLLNAVLINPGVAVSTAEVYRTVGEKSGTASALPPGFKDANALIAFLEARRNDLEQPALRIAPAIREVLSVLCSEPATLLVRMSGSGATCFGLFGSQDTARAAAEKIAADNPVWWVRATRIQ